MTGINACFFIYIFFYNITVFLFLFLQNECILALVNILIIKSNHPYFKLVYISW